MKKPLPMYLTETRPRCPVCGEVSYSRHGIHPQCAQTRADAKRLKRNKETVKRSRPAKPPAELTLKAWHKRCPRCSVQVHIRKSTCVCGHSFAGRSRP